MRFVNTLIDIGGAAPSVLEGVVGSDGNTALEIVRRAACTGAREVLDAPPPALLHESKAPPTNVLYGGLKSCPLDDGPFKQHDPEALASRFKREGRVCVGGLMMDVTKTISRPAIVYAMQDSATETLTLQVEVWRAPLAAMEAELFQCTGMPSAFERRWMSDDEAASLTELRRGAANYVRRCGYDAMPQWMHASEFCISRPGPLPLLRLRKPETHAEISELSLVAASVPFAEPKALKTVLEDCLPCPVSVETFFFTTSEEAAGAGQEDTTGVNEVLAESLMAPLALVVMKHLDNVDYYDVVVPEGALDAPAESDGQEGDESPDTQTLKQLVEDLVQRERALPQPEDAGPAMSHRADNVLMRVLSPTGRPCDSKILVRTGLHAEAAGAVADRFFSESDAVVIKRRCASQATVTEMIMAIGRMMVPRQALLVVNKAKDGKVQKCCLVAHDGDWPIANERISRYALCSWVTPIVLDGESVIEIKVQGVTRETMRLSERARLDHALPQTITASLPSELAEFLRTAAAGVAKLPELLQRLESLEGTLKQGVSVAVPSAATGSLAQPLPAAREPCEVQLGFKRANDHIEAYERAVAQRAR